MADKKFNGKKLRIPIDAYNPQRHMLPIATDPLQAGDMVQLHNREDGGIAVSMPFSRAISWYGVALDNVEADEPVRVAASGNVLRQGDQEIWVQELLDG